MSVAVSAALFPRLPSTLVQTQICTRLDFASHTRFALASRFLRVLCNQSIASPAAIVIDDRTPLSAFDQRPWLRPTSVDVARISRQTSAPAFPARLLEHARQLIWRRPKDVDSTLLLTGAPRLERLSLPGVTVDVWHQIVAACPRLVSLERCYVYSCNPHRAKREPLAFPFRGLRHLALSRLYDLVGCDELVGLAQTCPELECLEARIAAICEWPSGAESPRGPAFPRLERLHVRFENDSADRQQRTLHELCKVDAPRLRHLELEASCLVDLRPLVAFSTLEALNLRHCHLADTSDAASEDDEVSEVASDDALALDPGSVTPTSGSVRTTPTNLVLPDPLPHLKSFSRPPPNNCALDVPRSHAATLTELEMLYFGDEFVDVWRGLPHAYPMLRHLEFHLDGGSELDNLSGCVALAQRVAVLESSTTPLATLTLQDAHETLVYDMRRVGEHVRVLEPDARAALDWFDIQQLPHLRCVDRSKLDQRALVSHAFGDWHTAGAASRS